MAERQAVSVRSSQIQLKAGRLSAQNLAELQLQVSKIVKTEMVPSAYRGNEAATLAAVLAGAEMGLSPMASLRSIHMVEGNPYISSEALRAVALQQDSLLSLVDEEVGDTMFDKNGKVNLHYGYRVTGKRRLATGEVVTVSRNYRVEDAVVAGVWKRHDIGKPVADEVVDGQTRRTSKSAWARFPKRMLFRKASAHCIRDLYADAMVGGPPIREERDDVIEGEAHVVPSRDGDGNVQRGRQLLGVDPGSPQGDETVVLGDVPRHDKADERAPEDGKEPAAARPPVREVSATEAGHPAPSAEAVDAQQQGGDAQCKGCGKTYPAAALFGGICSPCADREIDKVDREAGLLL